MPTKTNKNITDTSNEHLEKLVHANTAVKQNDEQFDQVRSGHPSIRGADFDKIEQELLVSSKTAAAGDGAQHQPFDILLRSLVSMGSQASKLGQAAEILKEVLNERSKPLPEDSPCNEHVKHPCTVFLGFTSNQVTTGNREPIKYLVKHKMVDALVTTCGAIEEDIIKCITDFFLGDFSYSGKSLRSNGMQRYGNVIGGNNAYCDFEDLLLPFLDVLLVDQVNNQKFISISQFIHKLGEIIDDENSICYWAAKNSIPIYCPGILDGAVGDVIFTHSLKNKSHLFEVCPALKDLSEKSKDYVQLDGTGDLISLTKMSLYAKKKAMLVLGGSLPKHHIYNACLLGGGADYAVNINTASPYDCSDSGADPDEAVSWGKIKSEAKAVKVWSDATICFPLLVYECFVKHRVSKRK